MHWVALRSGQSWLGLALLLPLASPGRVAADTPRSESGVRARRPESNFPEAEAQGGATMGASIYKNNEILALSPDSPAERGGLQVGDVVTHMDGKRVSRREIAQRLQSAQPGSVVRVTVSRDGTTREVQVGLVPPKRERLPFEVRIAVAPRATRPGQEVSFAVKYEFTGAQPLQVVERREIVKDGNVLGSWEDTFTRSPGRIASDKRVRVAPEAGPGKYLARITLCADARLYRAYAEFELRP